LTEFAVDIDPSLPVCFLAFRPNFALEDHPGASRGLMDRGVAVAKDSGLENANGSGHAGIAGSVVVQPASQIRHAGLRNMFPREQRRKKVISGT